jgi:hypothetical protein
MGLRAPAALVESEQFRTVKNFPMLVCFYG